MVCAQRFEANVGALVVGNCMPDDSEAQYEVDLEVQRIRWHEGS